MKRLVALVMMLGLACGSIALAGITQAQAEETCTLVETAIKAIEAAQDFKAVDDAMVAAGFTPLSTELMEKTYGTLEKAKEGALEVVKENEQVLCARQPPT